MKPVLITWGFDPDDGSIYLDCYLEIKYNEECGRDAEHINIRSKSQGTKLALLHIPKNEDREYIEEYIEKGLVPTVLQLLNKAKVNLSDILRKSKKSDNQAIDFIMSY